MLRRSNKHMSSWRRVPLSVVAEPVSRPVTVCPGEQYRTLGVKWWGEGAYERQTIDGSQTAAKTLSIVRKDDLIINKIWVRHGSAAIADEQVDGCAGSGEFPTFDLSRDKVLPRWLHWLTKTRDFWTKCDALSRGTSGKNRIRPEAFLTIEIPLPPLSEQRRIVAKIDRLAAKIEEARGLRQLSSAAQEVMLPASLGAFFQVLAADHPVPTLRELATTITDGPHKTPHYVGEGIPFVTVKNMVTGQLSFSDLKYITSSDHAEISKRCRPERGDVLYSKDGATRGHPCFVDTDTEFNIFVSVALIKPKRDRLDGRYLCHLLNSAWIKDRMANKSRGDMIPHIVLGEIAQFPVPLPPLPEQRRIVEYLNNLQAKVDRLKELQAQTAAELDALLPSILDKAFKGEL